MFVERGAVDPICRVAAARPFGKMTKKGAKRLMSAGEMERVAYYFRLLGEPMRLKILQCISGAPKTVTEIVEQTGATQTNISKHLALLAVGGIVSRSKAGPFVHYKLEDELALELCRLVFSESRGRGR